MITRLIAVTNHIIRYINAESPEANIILYANYTLIKNVNENKIK